MDNGEPDQAARQLAQVDKVSKLKSNLILTAGGVVLPQTLAEVTELSQYMCKAGSSIPALMRGNPGECMGVIFDAMNWGMNPFAVARQRYIVEGKDGNQVGAYMSQLITAVIQKFAPIQEKVIAPIYEGEGPDLRCRIEVHHRDTGEKMFYRSPRIGPHLHDGNERVKSPGKDYDGIWPKNSPLWKNDPEQQIWYYSIRAWGRRFTPGILLGVYDIEEAHQMIAEMRDITPPKEKKNLLEDPDDAPAAVSGEVIDPPRKTPGVGTAQQGWSREDRAEIERQEKITQTEIAETIEPQVPLGDEDNLYEGEKIDPDTGEITVGVEPQEGDTIRGPTSEEAKEIIAEQDAGNNPAPAFTLEPPPEVTPELMFKNLAKSLADCKTVKDYEQWRSDNPPVDIKKAIGEKWWKQLGPIMTATEDRVGYL